MIESGTNQEVEVVIPGEVNTEQSVSGDSRASGGVPSDVSEESGGK
jgi:hypothetical protein